MKQKIAHSKPTIDAAEANAVKKELLAGNLSTGRIVQQFEQKLTQYQKSKGAVVVNSGTSAIHLALLALDVKHNDEVIIPSYVCSALLNAIHYTGANPRIVDVNDTDANISFLETKKNLTTRTKAIIIPHMFGFPVNVKPFLSLGVPIIEDCAQSIGAEYQNRKVGNDGLLNIFSFYATKVLTTGEGGAVVSDNTKLLDRIRDMRDYDKKETFQLRFNYKMTDLQASLGIVQLKKLPKFIKARQRIASFYARELSSTNCLLPLKDQDKKPIFFRYIIKTKNKKNLAIKALSSAGVHAAAPIYKPLHQYLSLKNFPITEQWMRDAVSIPIYPSLTQKEQLYIVEHLERFLS